MKLLFCDTCWDIFKLSTHEERKCQCGKVSGYYEPDGLGAIVNGEGYSLAIGNGSLVQAIQQLQKAPSNADRNYYTKNCRIQYAWVRPHEGSGNPHTTVEAGDD